MNRRSLTLALVGCPGIGGKSIARVHTRNDLLGRTPEEFLKLGEEALIEEYRIPPAAASTWVIGRKGWIQQANATEERLSASGIQWVTLADAHYPGGIEELSPDPPGVLFLYGNERLLRIETACVLASRDPDPQTLDMVEKLSEEHVLEGRALVSGHDTPAYQRAAVVPLRFGAPRILVLDRGHFVVLGPQLDQEPFAAARLWRFAFDPRTDLVVSAVPPERDYHRNSNRVRDKLVAGLSRQLDIVSARASGNMEQLAKAALRAGRPVRVHPGAKCAAPLLALGARAIDQPFVC
ncbi:MAG: DNA-processing protein DprA [Fimbriimonadaceae bacterium]